MDRDEWSYDSTNPKYSLLLQSIKGTRYVSWTVLISAHKLAGEGTVPGPREDGTPADATYSCELAHQQRIPHRIRLEPGFRNTKWKNFRAEGALRSQLFNLCNIHVLS